ncbi:MAG: hypothetical protein SRB2_02337 [Desulfobacteraceae bacterium Eth-SRB2]|nr:MAG: hypothetical protein SRB2_02337 [Desulfobacteraceae bacterium Eth-SRB2]
MLMISIRCKLILSTRSGFGTLTWKRTEFKGRLCGKILTYINNKLTNFFWVLKNLVLRAKPVPHCGSQRSMALAV